MLTKAEAQAVKGFYPAYETLWRDVQAAADRVHRALGTDQEWAWHHVLLAVANFKAQMPVFPARLPPLPVGENFKRGDTLHVPVPGGPLTLRSEDPRTWRELSERLSGLGVPRTTTVLSALWPGRHVIADWHALSAAVALVGVRNGWGHVPVEPNRADRLRVGWEIYSWYRRWSLIAPQGRTCIRSGSNVRFTGLATPCQVPYGTTTPRESRNDLSAYCHQ
jgi:hypothetical protein